MVRVLSCALIAGLLGTGALVAAERAALIRPASFTERAPDTFIAKFETSKGVFFVEVHRAWAPAGADRFYNLVKNGYYDECRFFRVLDSVMAQTGIHPAPQIQTAWDSATIKDDAVHERNRRGTVSFATAGPNSRTTQFFINLRDNRGFDRIGSAPFGQVTSGLDTVDALYSGYGDGPPRGRGPDQSQIRAQGNAYLTKDFPKLDYVRRATIEK
jgi:peptidyl-prolyl cis-trans isomerase A (cyclophilin A)